MNSDDQWIVYRTRFLVYARQLTQPLHFVDALGREHSGVPGDYLVESEGGFRRITPRAIFEDVYVPLAPSQPPVESWTTARPQSYERSAPSPTCNHRLSSGLPRSPVPAWSG